MRAGQGAWWKDTTTEEDIMALAFEAEGLVKRYGKTTALAGIDLAARRGTVPVEGDAVFTEIVRRLDQERIAVTELILRLPSLDEVFFTLTGRHTGQEAAA
ncbi:hypothetical protein FHR32_005371 [Streptosporangium album]|uniref:DUF4162 domain-containing protein n=1 Tax=Streptosporangium album TaxID=47479 RepID=A0A7W7WC88_9ACTN|nr:hypothetical protein [Streptosporangium album]